MIKKNNYLSYLFKKITSRFLYEIYQSKSFYPDDISAARNFDK